MVGSPHQDHAGVRPRVCELFAVLQFATPQPASGSCARIEDSDEGAGTAGMLKSAPGGRDDSDGTIPWA